MCVICYKAKGRKFPDETTMRAMWSTNPDGAGIMWKNADGLVDFRKGFMKFDDFLGFVKGNEALLNGTEVAMHFRIGTHGGNTPGNTHPFVVKPGADPHEITGAGEPFVLMHNGVLPVTPRATDMSDTAELALRAGLYDDPASFLRDIGEMIGSNNKIVLFRKDGDAMFYGGSWREGRDGLMYSNLNHEWEEDYWCERRPDWSVRSLLSQLDGRVRRKKGSGKKVAKPSKEEIVDAEFVPIPESINVGTLSGERIARDVIAECADCWAGARAMTPEEWDLFFESYLEDIEEQFWTEYDEETMGMKMLEEECR